jgi:hypothetical protein
VTVALVLAGCDAATADHGESALLQIPGAQLRPGPFPDEDGGPAIAAITIGHATITPGSVGESLKGVLGAGATAAVIGLDGDTGAWVVTAGLPELDTPDAPSLSARLAFADRLAPGPIAIDVAAVDAAGRVGAPVRTALVAEAEPPPTGELVIGLVWDGPADLDLHVVAPDGGEAWSGDPNTWDPPPPGTPPDPTAFLTGGILDHDGNAGCHRDGRPSEHVIWRQPPPAGAYTVRVDTRALCGGAVAYWYVAAYRAGALVGAAQGVGTADDVLAPHGAGAGVTALGFTLP